MESTKFPLVLLILLILVGVIFIYTMHTAQLTPYISSFRDCVNAGNPVHGGGDNGKTRTCTTSAGVEFKELPEYKEQE